VPEEDPLQALAALELVFEAEGVVLVGELEEVCPVKSVYMTESHRDITFALTQQFGRGLHDCEWRALSVVD
jgi:hypothetical protein